MISKSIICARAQLKSTGCKVCPYKYCQWNSKDKQS
jgi:hypothetical protein